MSKTNTHTQPQQMPERYRPKHAGCVSVCVSETARGTKLSITIPKQAFVHLDVGAGDYVSFLPRTGSTLRLVAGKHTGSIVTYRIHPNRNQRSTPLQRCDAGPPVADYLGVDGEDRVRYDYPEDGSQPPWLHVVGVPGGGDDE